MADQKTYRLQWYFIALAALFAIAHLAWQYIHGGVVSHHFLDRSDLPAISNWWGLIVLPVLGWLAAWSVLHRTTVDPRAFGKAIAAMVGAILVGAALSVAFVTGKEQATTVIFAAALVSGVVFPAYRAEYVLGFVLGMDFVFGPVLPTIAALVAVGISAAFHLIIWPTFVWLVRRNKAEDSAERVIVARRWPHP
ncbi:MAG TPA: hypothetical protein VFH85_09415 [Gammaproteobacteria bacterium]|nr:hypothetical protein [Gammaproteobacteria bacterium]